MAEPPVPKPLRGLLKEIDVDYGITLSGDTRLQDALAQLGEVVPVLYISKGQFDSTLGPDMHDTAGQYLPVRRTPAGNFTFPLFAGVQVAEPLEVTDAMVQAYLKANDTYWRNSDKLPKSPDKWRTGTPYGATQAGLTAALIAQKEENDNGN